MTIPALMQPFLATAHKTPPRRLGQRYSPTRFLPEAGNTVVCHLDWDDPAHAALITLRNEMMALPGAAQHQLFTPASSLHMTLFNGTIETLRTADAWPEGLDRACPVQDVTEVMLQRLPGFEPREPFRVKATGLRLTGLVLEGATDKDKAAIVAWRDALAACFGYRHKTHDSYELHMTFAYPTAWLPDDLATQWSDAYGQLLARLKAAAPVIPLRAPAFCTFADMTHFEELIVLR